MRSRTLAVSALDEVLGAGRMLQIPGNGPASAAERAEAGTLADLTLRRLGQIDALISGFVERMPKGRGQQILRLMACELVFLGTPAYAAVDMAVRLSRGQKGTSRLSGLINAVGRKIAAEGAEIATGQEAARLNMPKWLFRALESDWGADTARRIAEAHLHPAPYDLTLSRPDDTEVLARELEAAPLPIGGLRLAGRPQISTLPGYAQGAWWVQDAAAALPARLIPTPSGKRVLDLCAAPGGKTMQLAAAGAEVTALDASETRMERLRENLERTGLKAEVVVADALDWTPDAPFDAILLDAPCSATGTVRRHPELPYRMSMDQVGSLAQLQTDLAARAAAMLKPGGYMVFCTCSILKAEGETHQPMLAALPDMHPDPIQPGEIPDALRTAAGTMRSLPSMWTETGGLDGFFAARFRRGA